jgi:hypothetical protein
LLPPSYDLGPNGGPCGCHFRMTVIVRGSRTEWPPLFATADAPSIFFKNKIKLYIYIYIYLKKLHFTPIKYQPMANIGG